MKVASLGCRFFASLVICALSTVACAKGAQWSLEGSGETPKSGQCEVDDKCGAATYAHIQHAEGNPHCPDKTCRALSIAPDAARLICTRSQFTMDCEIWPRGDVHYDLSASGSIIPAITGPTSFPYQSFTCPSADSEGWAHAWVIAPSGAASYTSQLISCAAGSLDL